MKDAVRIRTILVGALAAVTTGAFAHSDPPEEPPAHMHHAMAATASTLCAAIMACGVASIRELGPSDERQARLRKNCSNRERQSLAPVHRWPYARMYPRCRTAISSSAIELSQPESQHCNFRGDSIEQRHYTADSTRCRSGRDWWSDLISTCQQPCPSWLR